MFTLLAETASHTEHATHVPGLAWVAPFVALLLCIAVLPLIHKTEHWWHHNKNKLIVALALGLVTLAYYQFRGYGFGHGEHAASPGFSTVLSVLDHAVLAEFIPFISLLFSLYVISGGICVKGDIPAHPMTNVAFLAIGGVIASLVGTTGASMLLIRPLLATNSERKHIVHTVIFFIFIVSNVGGCLLPIGDPPLFLGFLKGVSFFWTVEHVFFETLFLVAMLLVIFYALDSWHYRREGVTRADPTPDTPAFGIVGGINFVLLLGVMGLVLMSGVWKSGVVFDFFGTEVALPQLVRDGALIGLAMVSHVLTARDVREQNQFSWHPMIEVAKLFIGIFVTMVPVLAMLKAGEAGAFAAVTRSVTGADGQPLPWAYFWFSGALSSFLDNAPTYLVFFNLAGGDPQVLMTAGAATLAAISCGAVFMGANTYIGNAPNFMIKAIAEDRGIRMPSFFGYMAWSGAILIPLFVVMTFIWFR